MAQTRAVETRAAQTRIAATRLPPTPRLALVTGVGRSEGIGAAIADRLAADGWDLALTRWRGYDERLGLRPDADPSLRDLRSRLPAAIVVEADLEDPAAVPRLFDEVLARTGRAPQALVLSHCESVDSGVLDTTVASFDRHYAVNVRASWLLIRELATRLTTPTGRVVALTSDAVVDNLPYGATKGALDRLVLAAAGELGHLGITANAVDPGPTDTGWMSEELKAGVVAATPGGRVGTTVDAANLVAFLLSPDGAWVNGQVLRSDGGLRG